jgi:hypothetical protein
VPSYKTLPVAECLFRFAHAMLSSQAGPHRTARPCSATRAPYGALGGGALDPSKPTSWSGSAS